VEYPHSAQSEWQVHGEGACKGVAPAAAGSQANEIFQVRRKTADDQRRKHQPGAPEGKRCRCMREGEGHTSIMPGTGAVSRGQDVTARC
jgi:hypothetical protein